MPANACTYVVLSASGKVITLPPGTDQDYYKVLLELDRLYPPGHGVGDNAPATLICDGQIVVSTGLRTLARTYAYARANMVAMAESQAKQDHRPVWMED